jgi:hypothetical protein|tara:strand:- start:580 stop:834 length:255 start_codon:yes stop_codon:yes gene_type:complete
MSDTNDHYTVDINSLTIAEVVLIEEMTGLPLDALGQPDKPKGKMLQALAYISKRRDDPEFTWEMAGDLRINPEQSDPGPTDGDE